MKEIQFLKNNADKWKSFESLIDGKKKIGPDRLAELFIQLTDDLSYARTFYPDSRVTGFLNGLTAKFHQAIFKSKKEEKQRFRTFWTVEQPFLIRRYKKEMIYSLLIFLVALFIGVISSANDKSFVRMILGEQYIKMTLENIEMGDPMAVYKSMNEVSMFLGITINNIKVAMMAFAFGVLFSFGTGYILFTNGIMLGAFHYFFFERGLLATSVLSIWIHGTLEISAVIIAGSSGLIIGNSILFPGTYSRKQSFIIGARNGLKMLLGVIPFFIIAGFLEGFVTRHTDMPLTLSIGIIVLSFLFIGGFYIVYPATILTKEREHGADSRKD